MSQPNTIRASLVVSAVVVCSLAGVMAYLMTRPARQGISGPLAMDLQDATAQRAVSAGIKLTAGASHVFYKGRKLPGSAVIYARFDLPRQAFVRYQDRLARRPGAHLDENLPVPQTWPVLEGEMAAPSWFSQHADLASKVVVIEDGAASIRGAPAGKYWVLDGRQNRVYMWSWSVNIGKK